MPQINIIGYFHVGNNRTVLLFLLDFVYSFKVFTLFVSCGTDQPNFQMMLAFLKVLFALCMVILCAASKSSTTLTNEDLLWYAKKQATNETGIFSSSRVHVLRLGPGEDLLESLWRYARVTKIAAASVVSVVGSLTTTNIRYANQEDGTSLSGHFEIVSVVGNLDFQKSESEGSGHVHMAFSNEQGVTIGGHVLSGNIIYTTAEITILEIVNGLFDRVLDDAPGGSGYYELEVFHTSVQNTSSQTEPQP